MSQGRRSARVAALDSKPDYTEPNESGIKRKASTSQISPNAKRVNKKKSKQSLRDQDDQTTIDDAMDVDKKEDKEPDDPQSTEAAQPVSSDKAEAEEPKKTDAPESETEKPAESQTASTEDKPAEASKEDGQQSLDAFVTTLESKPTEETKNKDSEPTEKTFEPSKDEEEALKQADTQPPAVPQNTQADQPKEDAQKSAQQDEPKSETNGTTEPKEESKTTSEPATNGDTVQPAAREDEVPSSILEKGIIYFFFRPRVNISSPQDVTDIARSYFILRPLPHGAALSDGPIPDDGNARLIALPKKVLPQSGKDKFMAFVEKSGASFKSLKEEFMSGSDYATKTQGTSHSPPVTPVAEGVYAITTTGRDSHLAYITTIPNTLGEVQRDIGLSDSGSFAVSAKNPKYPGPANASLDKAPEYPEDIIKEFRDLRWGPLQPKLLEYVNTQFLLIGEGDGIEKAMEGLPRDEKNDKETPLQEIEKLEGEDEVRVKHLKGDDAVFADLRISKSEYPNVPSTW